MKIEIIFESDFRLGEVETLAEEVRTLVEDFVEENYIGPINHVVLIKE